MSEHNNPQSPIKRMVMTAVTRTAFTLTDVFQHITIVSLIGLAACAVGYFLFFQWVSYQHHHIELRRYLPAFFSVVGFMYAIYKAVPVLEDFWGLGRTRINTSHPLCMYVAIAMWVLFINSFIFAFGFQVERDVSFHVMIYNFFGRYSNDTPHYIAIAQYWYRNTLDDHRLFIVFFPFYSILVRVMYFVSPSYMFAAYVVSNIFAFAAGVMFYKLARLLVAPGQVRLAVKFLYVFPSAFFLFVPMTESLFLFLSVGVVYYAIKAKYMQVFVFGLLATLTRSAGILLIIPVACEVISQILTSYRLAASAAKPNQENQDAAPIRQGLTRADLLKLASLLAFPLGMGIYLLINYMVYGSPTQFMVFQREHWGQRMYFFWNTIDYLTHQIFSSHRAWVIGVSIPGVIVFWMSLLLIIYGANKLRPSLTLYAMAYFIFAFGPTWLMSGPRYAMVLFPLAFAAAKLAGVKKGYNLILTIAYVAMFILYFNEFVRNNFVF